MHEKDWQADVVEYATLNGWLHFHPYEMRRSDAGWPDLALWRPATGEFLLAELKGPKTRVTAKQRETLEQLAACGVEVHIWRPGDWPEMEARLRRQWRNTGNRRPGIPTTGEGQTQPG